MVQCTAFTKTRRRCKKEASNQTVCQYHQTYYDEWLKTHPAPNGWRLNIDEKEEYTFQIENGLVQITDEYIQSFNHPAQSDYYEYLLHLPHIQCDSNINMLIHVLLAFLEQFECIPIDEANINYFFGNIFKNPGFNPATFSMRIIYIVDRKLPQTRLPDLSAARIRDIFSAMLDHPQFASMLYMNWEEIIVKKFEESDHLPIFLELLRERKQTWRAKESPFKQEVLEIAMLPTRVVDWYLDWETIRGLRTLRITP